MELLGLLLSILAPVLSVLAASYAENAPARRAKREREQLEAFDESMEAGRWHLLSQQLERLLHTVRRHPR